MYKKFMGYIATAIFSTLMCTITMLHALYGEPRTAGLLIGLSVGLFILVLIAIAKACAMAADLDDQVRAMKDDIISNNFISVSGDDIKRKEEAK